MRLDIDGDFFKGLDMELMGDDTDEEEESAVAIQKLMTLIIYIRYGFITNKNLNSDDSCIHIL